MAQKDSEGNEKKDKEEKRIKRGDTVEQQRSQRIREMVVGSIQKKGDK